jgi:hypothetical protein
MIWAAIIILAGAGLGAFFNVQGRIKTMADKITALESVHSTVAHAIDALDSSRQAMVDAVQALQAFKGTVPDEDWLAAVNPLLQASQSNFAATAALKDEMATTTGATGS